MSDTPPRDWLAYGAVAALTIIWGSAFALTSVALQGYGPISVATGRIILAALVLTITAFALGVGLPRGLTNWAWCAAVGIMSLALPFSLLSWGQKYVESSVAGVMIAASPLFILVLAKIFLGSPVGPRKWVGFLIGFSGLIWLIGPEALLIFDAGLLPQLACAGAAFCYACSSIIVRKMPPLHPVQATAGSQLFAAVIMIPFGLNGLLTATPGLAAMIALATLGLAQTGMAQLLRYWAVKRAGPIFISTVSYLIPVWAGIIGVVALSEPITWQLVTGFALILSGLLIARNQPETARSNAP